MADAQHVALEMIEALRDQHLALANIVKALTEQVQRIEEELQKLKPPETIPTEADAEPAGGSERDAVSEAANRTRSPG